MSSPFKIKCLLVSFIGAIIMAASTFIFYVLLNNKKLETNYLRSDEKVIENQHKRSQEPFRFCVYPERCPYSQIGWSDEKGFFGNKAVKIIFKNNGTCIYTGIHLYLAIVLGRYVDNGIFEFWVKGGQGGCFVNKLNIYVKEGQFRQQMVYVSLPIQITGKWQKISFPLSELRLVKEGSDIAKEFSWTIQELLFSIESAGSDRPVELDISGMRVTEGKEIIYAIF